MPAAATTAGLLDERDSKSLDRSDGGLIFRLLTVQEILDEKFVQKI